MDSRTHPQDGKRYWFAVFEIMGTSISYAVRNKKEFLRCISINALVLSTGYPLYHVLEAKILHEFFENFAYQQRRSVAQFAYSRVAVATLIQITEMNPRDFELQAKEDVIFTIDISGG